MAIQKYRAITDLEPPGGLASPTENLRAAFGLIELCYRLRPWTVRRGVWRVDLAPPTPDSTAPMPPVPTSHS